MSFIIQLVDFINTPFGFIVIITGLFVVVQANQNRPRLGWLVIAVLGFAASLNYYADEFITEPPSLVFPLEQIREQGRSLTIVLLLLLIIIALKSRNIWRKKLVPQPIIYIILVQLTIFVKILVYGDIGLAFLTAVTFGAVVFSLIVGPSRWLQNEHNFQLGVWAMAMVGVIFGIANIYQASIDPYPITFIHGWFLGTTGNPHHAAVLITATLPCYLFLCLRNDVNMWMRWLWAGFLLLGLFALVMTASRTGAIMAVVSILIFFRYRGGQFLQIALIFAVLAALFLPYLSPTDIDTTTILSNSVNKLGNLDTNTRAAVWGGYWQIFLDYPIFGAPFQGDRLRFGESSWLGALGSLGIIGGLPMFMFAWSTLDMIIKLDRISKIRPDYYLKCSVVMAGLLSLLVGGISEAYLLGNLTFSVMAVFLYLILGNYIIEVVQQEYEYFKSQYYQNYSNLQTNDVQM